MLPSGELSFPGWRVLRRLRISLPMGSSGSSMVASCGGWRASLRGIPVQESSAGGASIRMEGVSSGLLVGGYRGSFGSCGSQESGSGFEIPWRLLSSTAGWIQGRRSLGCVPGRQCFSVCFISCLSTSVFCGSLKSPAAMELHPTCGWWHLPSGDGRRRRGLEESICTGTKGLLDFNSFSRDLCAIRQLSSVSFWMYLYADEYVYWFLNL